MSRSAKLPWSKFVWKDWKSDEALGQVSLAARGLWIHLLCVMHEAEPYGHLMISGRPATPVQIARSAGCTPDEAEALLQELEDARVCRRNDAGVIYSKRLQSQKTRQNPKTMEAV